ncbi:uncharacterized protein MELLADRAFT_106239 [Melampsora larici-populina 98AG31]|uniref:Nudix hydrolase domain-containing protein n=1 Tax=Melampsora larici-populina (strain 98AG31 / pathotype 3-4-7) TaxID=747676 RepID=F4RKR3_MELLP|nr:uncharacterized protein MELLADRAFT_106239 [Melampsora larici-populina 98AG31]EGG06995.1 hypothetical protein MELLADRAFT_106239 [Melampsora larici-populina 98AG31]
MTDFLLVSSRKHLDSWIFPKGQIEVDIDGNHSGRSALREAWEEAGIRGKVIRQLHQSQDKKPHKKSSSTSTHFIPRAEYTFWLIEVIEELNEWPERLERERKWVKRKEASDLVSWRQDGQVEALSKVLDSEICGLNSEGETVSASYTTC